MPTANRGVSESTHDVHTNRHAQSPAVITTGDMNTQYAPHTDILACCISSTIRNHFGLFGKHELEPIRAGTVFIYVVCTPKYETKQRVSRSRALLLTALVQEIVGQWSDSDRIDGRPCMDPEGSIRSRDLDLWQL